MGTSYIKTGYDANVVSENGDVEVPLCLEFMRSCLIIHLRELVKPYSDNIPKFLLNGTDINVPPATRG